MAFELKLAEGEALLFQRSYQANESAATYVFAVSSGALHLPMTQSLTAVDPWYLKRVPVAEVCDVRLQRIRSRWMLLLSLVMGVAGAILTALDFFLWVSGEDEFDGTALGVLAGGLILPYIADQRLRLIVRHDRGVFVWTAPLLVDKASRAEVASLLEGFVDACQRLQVTCLDERKPQGMAPMFGRGPSK